MSSKQPTMHPGIEIVSNLPPTEILDRCASVAIEARGTGMNVTAARIRVVKRNSTSLDLALGSAKHAAITIRAMAEPTSSGSRLDCRMVGWKEMQSKIMFVPVGKPMIPGGALFMTFVRNLRDAVIALDPSAVATIEEPAGRPV